MVCIYVGVLSNVLISLGRSCFFFGRFEQQRLLRHPASARLVLCPRCRRHNTALYTLLPDVAITPRNAAAQLVLLEHYRIYYDCSARVLPSSWLEAELW